MTSQPENTVRKKGTAILNPDPWIEQELPFVDGPGQGYGKSLQEAIECRQEADELSYEQPNDENLDRLSQEDESRLEESSVENPVRLPWEDEPRLPEPDIENPVNLPYDDEPEQGEQDNKEFNSIET